MKTGNYNFKLTDDGIQKIPTPAEIKEMTDHINAAFAGNTEERTEATKQVNQILIHKGNKGAQITYKAHRLIASAFIPNPENKPQVSRMLRGVIKNQTGLTYQ